MKTNKATQMYGVLVQTHTVCEILSITSSKPCSLLLAPPWPPSVTDSAGWTKTGQWKRSEQEDSELNHRLFKVTSNGSRHIKIFSALFNMLLKSLDPTCLFENHKLNRMVLCYIYRGIKGIGREECMFICSLYSNATVQCVLELPYPWIPFKQPPFIWLSTTLQCTTNILYTKITWLCGYTCKCNEVPCRWIITVIVFFNSRIRSLWCKARENKVCEL